MHPMINVFILLLTSAAMGTLSGMANMGGFLSMASGLLVTGYVACLLPWRS